MSAGQISVTGTLTLDTAGTFAVEVGGTASADYDQIIGTVDVTLGGTLDVTLINAFTPVFADEFFIVTGTTVAGEFDQIVAPALGGDLVWRVRIEPTQAVLVVTCRADTNADTVVNSLDFIAFLNAFVAGDPDADFNEDGTVNSMDFIAFLNAFTAGC
jgi:hypothetical protein